MERSTYRITLALVLIALMTAGTGASARSAHSLNDVTQQPDPKKKEMSAALTLSVENELLTLNAYFPEDAPNVKVALYNILGKLIELHPANTAGKGDQSFRFPTRGLPNGPYIVVIEANGQRVVNKVMVSR